MTISKKLLALLVVPALAACSQVSTQSDESGLHYAAGSFTSTKFKNCVSSGTRNFDGPGDLHYTYPAGQRSYEFDNTKAADAPPIRVVSKDNVEMTISGVINFNLNTSCSPITDKLPNGGIKKWPGGMLQKFHETVGLKYKAYNDGNDQTSKGWRDGLSVYFYPPLRNSMNSVAQTNSWLDLYNNPSLKQKIEDQVATTLPLAVKAQAGDDYFTNITVTLQKPEAPEALVTSLQNRQKAVSDLAAAEAQKLTNQAIADAERPLIELYGPQGYLIKKALDSGKITGLYPVPTGVGVTVPVPSAAPSTTPTK